MKRIAADVRRSYLRRKKYKFVLSFRTRRRRREQDKKKLKQKKKKRMFDYLVFDVDVGSVADEQSSDVHVVVNNAVYESHVEGGATVLRHTKTDPNIYNDIIGPYYQYRIQGRCSCVAYVG